MRTAFIVMTLGLLGCTLPTDAQIVPLPRAKQAISDPSMIIEDRGQTLEVVPTLRATPAVLSGTSRVQHKLAASAANAPFGPRHLGVVYNHALQIEGFLTGEIAFKPQGDGLPTGLDAAHYPRLERLTGANSYFVVAASPAEFIAVFRRLKARSDLAWVEAVVIYGESANHVPPVPAKRSAEPKGSK